MFNLMVGQGLGRENSNILAFGLGSWLQALALTLRAIKTFYRAAVSPFERVVQSKVFYRVRMAKDGS